jgi:hypothetical protein
LRQQRYRDRQKALRDGGVTPQGIGPPQDNGDEEGEPEWPISS